MTHAIGWAIIHSLWQAGLVALVIAILLYLTRRASAAARYAICVAGLVFIVVLPVATVLSARDPGTATGSVSTAGVAVQPDPASVVSADSRESAPQAEASAPVAIPSQPSVRERLESAMPWIVTLWLLGVILSSLRTIGGLVWARRLVRNGTKPVSDAIRGASARLADALGVRVAVRVLESSRVAVPMLVGWIRPVILLPVSVLTGLTPLQIEAILAHELAHVRRHDYLVNLLQTVVETLLFFHPAVWWLSGRIREERENACDELAVAVSGGDRVFYSRALLTIEESRPAVPALAVAATGGSLKRRIQRMLRGEHSHLELGPRWYAGVVTVALAVVTAGGVAEERVNLIEERADLTEEAETAVALSDTINTRPAEVVRYSGSGDLESRWSWAQSQARQRGYGRYWIGYLIDGDPAGRHWIHFDRYNAVTIGNTTISGTIRMDSNFGAIRLPGVPLTSVVGNEEPSRVAIFALYDNGRLARIRAGSYVFPMNFAAAPVLWLGRATDSESVARIASLDSEAGDFREREDLTSMVAAHSDAAAVVPALERWALDTSRDRRLREEAIDGLGHFSSPRVLAVLARVARSDPEERVRAEAVSALGELREPGALDTLRSFARTLSSERLRREAVEAIAELPDDRGTTALRDIASDQALDRRVQSAAVEAIADGNMDQSERLRALVAIVNEHPDEYVQGRAAEAIGELKASTAVTSALAQIARTHRSLTVRRRAMEALGELNEDDGAARVLLDIARTDADPVSRRRAVESLGAFKRSAVFEELARLATSGEPIDVRVKAVETYMDNANPGQSVAFARTLLASDAPVQVKREVVEALESVDDGGGIPLLIEVARTTSDAVLRRSALETLIDSNDPRAVAALRNIR
jgi:beta-lactamase regulating signal transducer with metallopeptidase domain/HEAT repeat protein